MWLHDVPQMALAGAVAMLGVVIMLELRSFKQLRRSVDINLGRVFEQLEKLRAESRQMLDAQAQALAQQAAERPAMRAAQGGQGEKTERPLASPESERPMIEPSAVDFLVAPPIANPAAATLAIDVPAGEARLLASLAAGRARLQASAAAADSPDSAKG